LCVVLRCAIIIILVLHNAPCVNPSEAMNRRCGWSPLVVTQPSTSNRLLCAVYVYLCTAFVEGAKLCQLSPVDAYVVEVIGGWFPRSCPVLVAMRMGERL